MRVIFPSVDSTRHGPPLSGPIRLKLMIFCLSGLNLFFIIIPLAICAAYGLPAAFPAQIQYT
jgi:hypothetical protein